MRDDDPVLYFEHKALFNREGRARPAPRPGRARAGGGRAQGGDVTVVATQLMRDRAEEAAAALADEGIDVELIDPRTLVPLDMATITASLERTSRLVVVQECPPGGSWGASMVAAIARVVRLARRPARLVSATTPRSPTPARWSGPGSPSAERIAAGGP